MGNQPPRSPAHPQRQAGIEAESRTYPAGGIHGWLLQSAHRWHAIRSGSGQIEGPDGIRRFGPGDLLLAPSGLRHRLVIDPGADVQTDLLRLRWRALAAGQDVDRRALDILTDMLVLARRGCCLLPLPEGPRKAACAAMGRMADLARCPGEMTPLHLKAGLLEMLAALGTAGADAAGGGHSSPSGVGTLRALLEHIERHFDEDIPVAQAAAIARMSPSRFHAAFRQATGTTLGRYVACLRVDRAARLLRQTDRPVVQIVFEAGFGSVSRFYEAFGAIVGTSPARFRSGT